MNLDRTTRIVGVGALCVMLVGILAMGISEVHSFDVFWQLVSGKYMSQTHSFIRTDTFTLMKDVPRPEHTWLHSLILYFSYLMGGYAAISILKGLLVVCTLVFLIISARVREASYASIALLVPIFILTRGAWLERPQLWTFLLFALFVWLLEIFRRDKSWKILWLLPAGLFWINVHGGSVLALAILAAYFVGDLGEHLLLKRRFPEKGFWKILIPIVTIPIFGAVATPYPSHWFTTLFYAHKLGASADSSGELTGPVTAVFNMDWTPTTFQEQPYFFYAMGAVVIIMLLGWRRLRFRDVCLMVGLAIMGMKLVRHIAFFYMAIVAICPVYLDAAVDALRKKLPTIYQQVGSLLIIVVALGTFAFMSWPIYKIFGAFNVGLREWHYPIKATEFVEEQNLPKNIFNTYDWGGYMAWKLYPEYLMFWDGRQTSREMFSLGLDVMSGKPGWDKILERFNVNTIVSRGATIDIGQKYPLLDRLRFDPEWSLVFNSESSMVFVKNKSVNPDWLKRRAISKERIDDTLLAEGNLMVRHNINRYMAWWQMAQIYAKRGYYKNALVCVQQYIQRAPQPKQEAYYLLKQMEMMVQRQKQ